MCQEPAGGDVHHVGGQGGQDTRQAGRSEEGLEPGEGGKEVFGSFRLLISSWEDRREDGERLGRD